MNSYRYIYGCLIIRFIFHSFIHLLRAHATFTLNFTIAKYSRMADWGIYFIVAGIVEFLGGSITMVRPGFLFPGDDPLGPQYWGLFASVIGQVCFWVFQDEPGSKSQLVAACATLLCNLGVCCMTIVRLYFKMQVDGPAAIKNFCIKNMNRANGILGVFIHTSLIIVSLVYIKATWNRDLLPSPWLYAGIPVTCILALLAPFCARAQMNALNPLNPPDAMIATTNVDTMVHQVAVVHLDPSVFKDLPPAQSNETPIV